MAEDKGLEGKEFIGTILPNKDPLHRGRYKVYIPDLQVHMEDNTGIMCSNHVCKNRVSPSQNGVCGSYYPLQPGMQVIVRCFGNDPNSAYIDRIISDPHTNSLPYEVIERDDFYQIIRTPKHNNLIAIYEGDENSKNVPKNSIHIYFNDTRTTVVIDETGINVKTADNINITVDKNVKITVTGTADIKVTGNANIESAADVNVKAGGKANIQAGGDANVKSGGKLNLDGASGVDIKGGGPVNIQGAPVNVNGVAVSAGAAASAVAADAPTLITPNDFDYFKQTSGK